MKTTLTILSLVVVALATAQQGEHESEAERAAQAARMLTSEIGVWDCRWEYFGPNGEIANTIEGTETFEEFFPGRVLSGATSVPALGRESRALKFYDPNLRQILHISVGSDGDHWTLEQELGSEDLTSRPHRNADGSVSEVRFLTEEHDADRRVVRMEHRANGGAWQSGFRQTMVRRTDPAHQEE